jgi:hypothetical protein
VEIVLAILLLFGGFTLGSVTADKGGDVAQHTTIATPVDGAVDSSHIHQDMRQHSPIRCHSRTIVYRDLTVPYSGQIDQPSGEGSDCEGRDCSYHPSAFPPSLQVRSPDE